MLVLAEKVCPILFLMPTDSTSYSGNTTFELSSLGDGVRTSDLEDLKANAIKCLTDGFFKKLLDLEEVHYYTWWKDFCE